MCTTLPLCWMLVSLASLVITGCAAQIDFFDLDFIITGVPATPKLNPVKSADLLENTNVDIETMEGPMPPLKVSSMDVTTVISLRYAHTTVLTKMRNPTKVSQKATFRIILSETAFITGFIMTLNGIPYVAYVKEKKEAKNIYTQAVNQGLGAAHIAAKARDSNHFTVSVNVEPSTKALFNLTYEELLIRRLEVYNHVINLNPGCLVPDLTVNIFIKEGRKITTLRVPELRTGNEVDAQESDTGNEFATIERNSDNTEAYIKFAPNLKQQQTLMQVYAEKYKKSANQSDSFNSFNPHNQEQSADGVLGQFVVQYDVERDPNNGEVMVNDGYFVHFFSSSGLKPLKKHAIFVLDTSFSMWGRKMEQLKEAMTSILGELRPGDYFSIIEFNTHVQIHDLKNLKKNFVYRVLPPPTLVTLENIQKAKMIIQNLQATGLTDINKALYIAVVVALTGLPTSDVISARPSDVSHIGLSKKNGSGTKADANVEDQKSDPIIIFLTDGQPSVGEMNVERILYRISELNGRPNRMSIFTLAFGEDADRDFLRKLSIGNSGFLRHIYEAADAVQQIQHFYKQVADPLLSHIRFIYPADQVDDTSLTKHKFKTLFYGEELVVAGKVLNKDVERVTPTVTAISSLGHIDFTPKPITPVETDKTYWPLERLWVYLHIKQLLDQKDVGERAFEGDKSIMGSGKKSEQEALELALQYSFVTPLTSLVVVKPNDMATVNVESVDKADIPYNPVSAHNSNVGRFWHNLASADKGDVGSSWSDPVSAHEGNVGSFWHIPASAHKGDVGSSWSDPVSTHKGNVGSFWHIPASAHKGDVGSSWSDAVSAHEGNVGSQWLPTLLRTTQPVHTKAMLEALGLTQSVHTKAMSEASGITQSVHIKAMLKAFGLTQPVHTKVMLEGFCLPAVDYDIGDRIFSDRPHLLPSPDYDYDYSIFANSKSIPTILEEYKLSEFQWLEQYLDAASDSVNLPVNGTTVNLKLFKGTTPWFTSEEPACTESLKVGSTGTCKYLTDCAAAKNIVSLDVFLQHRCEREGYAAVCCPAEA